MIREGFRGGYCGTSQCRKVYPPNALAKKDLAITSNIAGTTRDSIGVELNLGGVVVEFTDTAGLRENPDNRNRGRGHEKNSLTPL